MRLEQINSAAAVDLNNPTANLAANFNHNFKPSINNQGNNNQFSRALNNNYCGRSCGWGAHRDLNRLTCQLWGRQRSFITSPPTINDEAWYIDSGATNRITANLNTLSQKTYCKGNE